MVFDERGRKRNLGQAEQRAFWGWAAIEFLQHTGARIEEMQETSHHSLIQYKLPSSGEVVPLLQIAPSKTDQERLLLISPELADVLSTIITRVRDPRTGVVPHVASYDKDEKVWRAPMPLLFQWCLNGENAAFSDKLLVSALDDVLEATGLTGSDSQSLHFTRMTFGASSSRIPSATACHRTLPKTSPDTPISTPP
ncbi:hypothetical protein [Streptomyces violens]|uniref:hypothetical protein n=1 Tax=Streptomyces violens TaxID=66377 RepID=UPI0004BF9D7A|nr:hypothetical protein [Streptomyces violens]